MKIKKHMTKLGKWNRYFFQFLFTRLTKHIEKEVVDYKLLSYDQLHDGTYVDNNISSRGVGNIVKKYWYSFQFFPVPLTGWNSDYKYLIWKKPKYLRITKTKRLD